MFWKSISLKNYLPFSHANIKQVEIAFDQPITAFLGTNGCGKSSLLRALTPYPEVRTNFGKEGKIVKVLTHNGHIYELTSDFSNAAAPHSFKMDDQELNISGTTETQRDLVEEHFGLTKLVDDILAGNVKICSTSKAERKALFSATYPGDLSFVIEYHKQVCSMIRVYANQLKLLKSREASLRSCILDQSELTRLQYFKSEAEKMLGSIDKGQLLLEAECDRWKKLPNEKDYCHFSYDGWNKLDVRDEILCLGSDVIRGFRKTGIRKQLRDNFDANSIMVIANRHFDAASNIRYQIERATRQVEEIRAELDKFIQAREANASANEKTQLEDRYKVCQKELEEVNLQIGLDTNGVVDRDKLDEIESKIVPYVRSWVESIHGSSGSIMSRDELVKLGVQLEHQSLEIATNLRNELSVVTTDIQNCTNKLQRLESRAYPKDCVQVCPLRSSVEESIESTRSHLVKLIERKKTLLDQCSKCSEFIQTNQPIYDEQRRLHGSIQSMIAALRSYNLEATAFNSEDPILCCNQHCFEIGNRIANACTNTRLHERKQRLVNEMESIHQTLSTMASTKRLQMSIDLIDQTIRDREEKLNVGVNEIIELEEKEKNAKQRGEEIKRIAETFDRLDYRITDAHYLLNQERIELVIKWHEDLILELASLRIGLQEELLNVTKTLQEQQKSIDILNDEILPNIKKLEHDKHIYEVVADGLSPTSGLPCIYLIRFINRLLTRANEIIRQVWMYNMELMYLKEEDNLDFTIQVLIRNSTIVKDINLCSNGQKAIIDLAMTIALCQERGFLNWAGLCLDECDAALTDDHRTKLVSLINKMVSREEIKQLFLVNHFAIQTGMDKCDSVVLSEEGIIIPFGANEHAKIE